MSNAALPPNDQEMTLVQHLLDLKASLTRGILAIIVFFIILFPFANDIYVYISEPLTRYLPEGTSMIATAVASPFLTPFKLSFVLAIYLAMPFLLYQLWRFIAPALYQHERQLVAPLLFFSSFLFYAGGLFAYYVVFPLVFGFLSQSAPDGVTIATDIALYLDFVIKMFFAFGMAFEVPIVTILLIITGMTKPEKLSHARPYIVVGAFVIGMLLTPPDIISQTLLAVPMWLLFELGLVIGAMILKRRQANQTDENSDGTQPTTEPVRNDAKSTAQSASNNTEAAAQASTQPEYDFDDRYADQVDDDLDWDAEFDKIDSEMSKLERDYEAKQKAEKEKSKHENPDDTNTTNQETSHTADASNHSATDETNTPEQTGNNSVSPKDTK